MNIGRAVKKNLVSNIALFLLNGIIGFWLPSFLIKRMGAGAYGLIPLASAVIGYVSLITVAINGSLSRFLVIDIKNEKYEHAGRTFNTAVTSLAVLFLALLPFLLYFTFNISSFISVPQAVVHDATVLFTCAAFAFILSAFTSLFNTSAYLANRLDLVNSVSVISTLVRVVLILFIFFFIKVSLSGYGFALIVASIASSCYSIYLFRKYTPYIKVDFRQFNKGILKDLLSMGGWLVVIQLGSILFLQIDLLVINKTIGPKESGEYSVLLQWSNMIRTFTLSLSGTVGPILLNFFALNKRKEMMEVGMLSNKFLSLFVACAVGVLCIVSEELLVLWLGPEFGKMKWLFIIMLVHLPINLGVLPLFGINRAFNKVRLVGIVTCLAGLLNLGLALFFVKQTNLGMYGVAIAGATVLTLKNFLFIPLYVARNMEVSYHTFFKASISSVIVVGLALLIGQIRTSYFTLSSWGELIMAAFVSGIILAAASFLLLTNAEKKRMFQVIKAKSNF